MSLKLWKDLVDDASVNTLPENGSFKAGRNGTILSKQNPFSFIQDRLILADGCAFDFFDGNGWRQISNRGDIVLNPAILLDEGNSYIPGIDYCIYLVLAGSDNPEIIVSRNTTFPLGYTANNSRKIGGFHYGHIRITDETMTPIDSTGARYGSGGTIWQNNVTLGIIPNSVWDLKNRPKVLFGGMVKVGSLWISIYQASASIPVTFMNNENGNSISGGELQSLYGQIPVTGTEGLNQYNFVELAGRIGMRLPSYEEWLMAAIGSPQGEDGADNYGWTKTTNTARTRTGCGVNPDTGVFDTAIGIKRFAISAYNCVDMIGNVWEWLSDYSGRFDAVTGGGWQEELGPGMGNIWAFQENGLTALRAGGYWRSGVRCGPRAVLLATTPLLRTTSSGVRLACDAA